MDNTELELRRTIAAAERARALIDDPLLVGAFEALDRQFTDAWRNSAADDQVKRERIWHHIQALAEVRAQLNTVLNDGTMAQAQLDELRTGTDNL